MRFASRLVIGYWWAGYDEFSCRLMRSAFSVSFMW